MPSYLPEGITKNPRAYLASGCNKGSKFLQGLGRLGEIEIESGVLRGLDTLVNITESGGPALTKQINQGANGVLDAVFSPIGFGSQEINTTLNSINPSAVNRALGNANIIVEKMENRDFTPRDIPSLVQDFKALGNEARNALDLGAFGQKNKNFDPCTPYFPDMASPHAVDMISRGIKYKFNFIVEFKYNSPYNTSMSNIGNAFMIKNIRLPQVQFEHTDVNMYNYRTKVPVKTIFDPINMTFYDDDKNHVLEFYNMYLKTISPITNNRSNMFFEQNSMNFDDGLDSEIITPKLNGQQASHFAHNYSSTIGPLSNETNQYKNTIIDRILIYHIFDQGAWPINGPTNVVNMNVYEIFNPKIISMDLPELDMTASENTELSLSVAYDSFYIHNNLSTSIFESEFNILSAQSHGLDPKYYLRGHNEDPNKQEYIDTPVINPNVGNSIA